MWPLLGWFVAMVSMTIAVTQVLGFGASRCLSVLHALTPHVLVVSVPVGAIAVATGQWLLAALFLPGLATLVWLTRPLISPPAQPPADTGTEPLRLFHSNVLYNNRRLDDAAETYLDADADVLVFTEYSPDVAEALLTSPLAGKYPFKLGVPAPYAAGTVIWSRLRLTEVPAGISTASATVVADVHTDDGWAVRIAGVHPPSPLHHFRSWVADLRALDHFEITDAPTVMAGDYNASWYHPLLRRLLSGRFRNAHHAVGRGFSASWHDDVPAAAFVRLDHALVSPDIVVDDVTDVKVPGSDHRAFTVTLRPAATARS